MPNLLEEVLIGGTLFKEEMETEELGVTKNIPDVLLEIRNAILVGGGGGGTTDYAALTNKPKINNVELVGNKSLSDFGLAPKSYIDEQDEGLAQDITNEQNARINNDNALDAAKVSKQITGANGKALIFNEADGGGAKFEHSSGIDSFVGVNDGGLTGINAQIYSVKKEGGSYTTGTFIDVKNDKIYYYKGAYAAANVRDVADNEIAVKGDLTSKLNISDVINNVTSTDIDKPLSANMGKYLNDRINGLSISGRWLTYIDCANEAVDSMPPTLPYEYKSGDYFIVKVGGTKKPKDGVASIPAGATNIEWESTTQTSKPGDVWRFDHANQKWLYEPDYTVVTSFSQVTGDPMDNSSLAAILNAKQPLIDNSHKLSADLIEDGTTNKAFTATLKTLYDGYATGKQNTITSTNKLAYSLISGTPDLSVYRTATAQDTIDEGKQDIITGGTANNIVAYSGTEGTLNVLTRVTSVDNTSTDLQIPTAKCLYDLGEAKQNKVQYIVLAAAASSGTVTADELALLLASKENRLLLDDEEYYSMDVKVSSGYLAYSHVEKESSSNKIKTITITIATRAWVKNEQYIPTVLDTAELGKMLVNLKINANGVISSDKEAVLEVLRKTQISDANQAVAFHNAIPGGRNISSYLSDAADWDDAKAQFWKRLEGGTFNRSAAYIASHPDEPTSVTFTLFEGLFPGDYWQLTEKIRSRQDNNGTAQTNEGTDYVMIAGFDTLWGNGDGTDNVEYHHIVCIPGRPDKDTMNAFGQHRMNDTNTSNGGYKGSQLATTVIGSVTTTGIRFSASATASINNQLFAEFGAHLATTRELLSNAMQTTRINAWGEATGGASSWEWTSVQACLMSEVEVYGSVAVSSTAHDVGNAKTQLPVFRFFPIAINNRKSWYWLKAVCTSAAFCFCSHYGYATDAGASCADCFVRPRFVLKA